MEIKPNIELKVNQTLESAKKIHPVDVPAFFTEKTLNRLHHAGKEQEVFTFSGWLKIAAVILLLIINTFTIKYVLGSQQAANTNKKATVTYLVNEYQPNDSGDLTFDQNFDR